MEIIWDWSTETEANRLLQTTRDISNGFFHLQNFQVLPWDPKGSSFNSGVYLPKLDYLSIPNFWSKVAKLNNGTLPIIAPDSLSSQTKGLLSVLDLASPDTSQLVQTTELVFPKVISFLESFVPGVIIPTTITICPTYFGTLGSFSLIDESRQITIYIRVDQGIHTLVECLLTSTLRPAAYKELLANWGETEFLVDWLIAKSSLKELLPPDTAWEGTLATTRGKLSPSTISTSIDFLHSIGAPSPDHQHFTTVDGLVCFNKTVIFNLSQRENALLVAMIAKSPLPICFDEIGNTLFTKDEKFSLAAISKTIERLRTKLNDLGISSAYLSTASGIGYYLKN